MSRGDFEIYRLVERFGTVDCIWRNLTYSHAATEWQEIFAEEQVPYASAKIMGCTKFCTMRAASR